MIGLTLAYVIFGLLFVFGFCSFLGKENRPRPHVLLFFFVFWPVMLYITFSGRDK